MITFCTNLSTSGRLSAPLPYNLFITTLPKFLLQGLKIIDNLKPLYKQEISKDIKIINY